ncbi:hypothetical protein ANN_12772 [Periplaneta americana]|uniref:Uncharacterized protein n=1 Tax=Periplaneta americana TaxID=6978 RepID=A0ABQ8THN5_PERAM|nr:hypothetical protein ANN_12772 [Periplaneta americana]
MKDQDRLARCWPHVHIPKQRWTIIQPVRRYRVVSTMITPAVIVGFGNRIFATYHSSPNAPRCWVGTGPIHWPKFSREKFFPHEDWNQRAFLNEGPRQDALDHDETERDTVEDSITQMPELFEQVCQSMLRQCYECNELLDSSLNKYTNFATLSGRRYFHSRLFLYVTLIFVLSLEVYYCDSSLNSSIIVRKSFKVKSFKQIIYTTGYLEAVATSSYGLARSLWTSVPRKKSILSRLRTSHNIRDIAPDQGLLFVSEDSVSQRRDIFTIVKTPILISKISILNSKFVPSYVGNKVRDKLKQVLQRNVGLKDLRTASDILAGKNTDLQCNIVVHLVSKLKYAPVTSVDVERSFPAYKFVSSKR